MNGKITPKQLQVLKLLADGLSSEEIAKQLGNSNRTIDSIRRDMLRQFQVNNVAHLVSWGYKNGYLE